jgi:DUF1009 family protein
MPPKLAILAGSGALPGRLIEACRASGRDFLVVAVDGHADPAVVGAAPHMWMSLTAAGDAVEALRQRGITELVMAGTVRRPSWSELRKADTWTAKFVGRLGLRALGDDGLLSAITEVLETEGFRILGPDEVVDGLVAEPGPLGRHAPDQQAIVDIDCGVAVARALGALDVGQAVVVQQGIVLGVEAVEGTDALIERCRGLARDGPGGVLVKVSKPQQDRRLDLPAVGPGTATRAAAAGLRGIAVEAGRALILDRDAVVAAADAAGLFIYGIADPS